MDDELHVHQAPHPQGQADAGGVVDDGVDFPGAEVLAGVDGHGIAAMDAGAFHMLHDAGYQHLLAVADGVNLAFFAFQVPVDQHRLVGRHLHGRG